jgi:capsule synthesis protein PGA_cap/fungalysin metallopeptidase (M36)
VDSSGSMPLGRVYLWTPDSGSALGGHLELAVAPLEHLNGDEHGSGHLHGRFVHVRNGGAIHVPDDATGAIRVSPIGDAQPDSDGNFLFEPRKGGGRLDKVALVEPDFRVRYIQASHFGEVNTYFHLDRIAAYMDELLHELGAQSLPPVVAVVNAHAATTEVDGVRDGVRRSERWLPFQGGHYRLPSRRYNIDELEPLSPNGEIHVGTGWQLLDHGALVEVTGKRYRANAAHNAGILYHEYGHHITRHTADFRANALRRPQRQNNRKIAMDEGTCDYWAATMLDTPHIWAWHRRHDEQEVHPRSLTSPKTMEDYDAGPGADPHANGTIWGAALWDVRSHICSTEPDGARKTDQLLLLALLLIGRLGDPYGEPSIKRIRQARKRFSVGLSALLHADERLYGGQHRDAILACFGRRGILPEADVDWVALDDASPTPTQYPTTGQRGSARVTQAKPFTLDAPQMRLLLNHVAADEIPASEDLLSADALAAHLAASDEPPFSLVVVGDIMLGGRTTAAIARYGADYPLAAVAPLLRRAPIVLGNLEGPFARKAHKTERTFSYRVNPALASALTRAGVNVLMLANNHLLDCGRAGVVETLETLAQAGIAPLGAGINTQAAHAPVIRQIGSLRIGLLGYYWNSRCAARDGLPGGAMDTPEAIEADIHGLRSQVDRVVVTFHWGIPYEREPLPEDRAKARFAIDCGADAVVSHHPHVVQPFEVYRERPIVYSIGNFAFGSGNSKAEGLLVGLRFGERRTQVGIYPLYVKNRDPRVFYQPKALSGKAAERILCRLVEASGQSGGSLRIEDGRGLLDLPWSGRPFAD